MKAFQITEYGQQPQVREVERPEPGQGEVLVRIRACGINFADLLMAKGTYQERPPLPMTPVEDLRNALNVPLSGCAGSM